MSSGSAGSGRDERVRARYGSVRQWCAESGIGRTTSYELIARGILRAGKVGAKTIIDIAAGLDWLDGQMKTGAGALPQPETLRRQPKALPAPPHGPVQTAAVTPTGVQIPPPSDGSGSVQKRPRRELRKGR